MKWEILRPDDGNSQCTFLKGHIVAPLEQGAVVVNILILSGIFLQGDFVMTGLYKAKFLAEKGNIAIGRIGNFLRTVP